MKLHCNMLLAVLLLYCLYHVLVCAEDEDKTCEALNENADGTCTESKSPTSESLPSPSHQCNLYVAPSTIPNAGLGVFTTVPLQRGHVLDGDVIIPVLKLDASKWTNPFEDFVWDAEAVGMELETNEGNEGIDGQCPGLDAMLNCHFGLLNIKRGKLKYNDDIAASRAISYMAGSMTPYHNATSIVSQKIVAGGELFKSYGQRWFRQRTETVGLVPLLQDFDKAERLLKKLRALEVKYLLSMAAKLDLFQIMTFTQFESRTMNALPRNYNHVDTILNTSIRSWHQQNATRTTRELITTGRCLDNIRPGTSTLAFAGRGAFATRTIERGTIITGSPLVHVPTMDLAIIRDQNETTTSNGTSHETPLYHLWINYCLGHVDGDLLLCPYGSGVNYMNHNQTLANVKLQWTPHGILSHNDDWFSKSSWSPDQVIRTHFAMDYVATRDIEQGEELFLDYGNDFEHAFQKHVENWKPSKNDTVYLSARQWYQKYGDRVLRTRLEQETDPYPSNLMLRCHSRLEKARWKLRQDEIPWEFGRSGHECEVVFRNESESNRTYTVYMVEKNETRENVPRILLKMMDAPHSTDWHRRDAFRHWIGIPEDMFPDAWRRKE